MIDFFDFVRTEKKLPDFFTFFRKTFTSMKRSIDAKYKGCDVRYTLHKKIQTVYCDAMNITEDLLDHSPIDAHTTMNPKL